MDSLNIGTAFLAYKVYGKGPINLVIEAGLNTCSAEWWHIGEKLANRYTVLVYDRAGYGTSSISYLERTPFFIAQELRNLLAKLNVSEKVTILAHSQGGLYAQQFTRSYPNFVHGLILLDPMSANNSRYQALLSPLEYKKSGIDKISAYKLAQGLTQFGLGSMLRPIIKKAPPFQYYRRLPFETTEYIIGALSKSTQYKTAIEEYELAQEDEYVQALQEKFTFPDIPLILITHTSRMAIEENMQYSGINRELADKVERIGQSLMKEYLTFSTKSKFVQAKRSTHHIHLSEFEIVNAALAEVMGI
jgi:pimeloyl-ACP methyl ester carboxylesterase